MLPNERRNDMRRWQESVNNLCKTLRTEKEIPFWKERKEDAINSVEYYREQLSRDEEEMTFKQYETYEKKIIKLENYVFSLYPDYKEKRDAEEKAREEKHNKMIASGKVEVIHLTF